MYKFPGCGKYPKNIAHILYFCTTFICIIFSLFICLSCLFVSVDTMAKAAQDIRDLMTKGVQSSLDGESDNDSQRSLPQVPDATINGTGLSSVRQNLSFSFNRL